MLLLDMILNTQLTASLSFLFNFVKIKIKLAHNVHTIIVYEPNSSLF